MRSTVVAACFALGASSAWGQPQPKQRAAIAVIDAGERVSAHVVALARATITSGLESAGYTVVDASELPATLATCRHGECIRDLANLEHVDAIVIVSIKMRDESQVIDLELFDGNTTQRIAQVHEFCDLCGEAELDDRLGVAASGLRAQAVVASELRARREIDDRPATSSPPSQIPGLVLGVAGLVTIGAGAYALSLDGKGTCSVGDTPVYPASNAVIRYPDPNDPGRFVCRNLYHTQLGGLVAMGAGVLALTAGVALVIRARDRQQVVEVTPLPGGARLSVAVSW